MATLLPAHSKAVFPKLMAVMDVLEENETASIPTRSSLIRATAALCQDQGLIRSPEAIVHAVDKVMAEPVNADLKAPVPFDFGWKRPTSPAELASSRRVLDHWPRRLLRLGAKSRHVETGHALADMPIVVVALASLVVAVIGTISLAAAEHRASAAGVLSVSLLCMAWVWARIMDWNLVREMSPWTDISDEAMESWKRHAPVREYIRHAVAATGTLLNGDHAAIDGIMKACEQQAQAAVLAERHREMAAW